MPMQPICPKCHVPVRFLILHHATPTGTLCPAGGKEVAFDEPTALEAPDAVKSPPVTMWDATRK